MKNGKSFVCSFCEKSYTRYDRYRMHVKDKKDEQHNNLWSKLNYVPRCKWCRKHNKTLTAHKSHERHCNKKTDTYNNYSNTLPKVYEEGIQCLTDLQPPAESQQRQNLYLQPSTEETGDKHSQEEVRLSHFEITRKAYELSSKIIDKPSEIHYSVPNMIGESTHGVFSLL